MFCLFITWLKSFFIFLADKSQAIFYTSAIQKEQVQRRFYFFPQVSMSELRCYLSLLKCFLQPNWHFSSLRIPCLIFWYFTEILFKIKWTWISQTLSVEDFNKVFDPKVLTVWNGLNCCQNLHNQAENFLRKTIIYVDS